MKMPAKPLEREKGLHVGAGRRDEGLRENQDGQAVETLCGRREPAVVIGRPCD